MPPDEKAKGGPGATRNPPEVSVTTKTNTNTNSVRHSIGGVTPMQRHPVAYASQFGPDGSRTQWWITYPCPHCGSSHFGRSREQITNGVRFSRCGRRIWLVIARTYRGKGAAA